MHLLHQRSVGIEAGLASAADAERLVLLDQGRRALRILIEVGEQDAGQARAVAGGIPEVLRRAGMRWPLLLHGIDATLWEFVALAARRRWSTPVGQEDGSRLADGTTASGNAALVAAAAKMFADARTGAMDGDGTLIA